MYELTISDCQMVGGGTGGSQSSGSPAQVCTTLPSGAAQCTSTNGRTMVIQNFDKEGNLVVQTVCTEGASGKIAGKAGPVTVGEVALATGTVCSSTDRSSNPDRRESRPPGPQMLIYSPFFYGAP